VQKKLLHFQVFLAFTQGLFVVVVFFLKKKRKKKEKEKEEA